MKKNFLAFIAVALVITLSAFTAKQTTDFYMIYDGSNTERDISSYTPTDVQQSHDGGAGILNWLKVEAESSEGPTSGEFISAFDALDVTPFLNPNGVLSDESDVNDVLDVKAD